MPVFLNEHRSDEKDDSECYLDDLSFQTALLMEMMVLMLMFMLMSVLVMVFACAVTIVLVLMFMFMLVMMIVCHNFALF